MGTYFGTDGFRGEANLTLTADHAFRLGRFLGWYYGELRRRAGFPERRVRVVIGKDARRSGYMLEYALAAGLTASGADAYLLHVTTTPSVSFVARSEGFDCAAMISASHNPYYDNGIKLLGGGGEKLDDAVTSLAEDYLDGRLTVFGQRMTELPFATRERIGRTVDYVAGRNRYIGYLISLAAFSLRGLRVGLDCANGSAWSIARAVYDALGATTYLINDRPNGFNINADAGSTHIGHLQRLVREQGLDVGFAFDGDADRCIAVDERGEEVDGDGILYLCARHMKQCGELPGDTVVGTVMANGGLEQSLGALGLRLVRTAVGDRHVWERMSETGARLGGEPSGHVIFSKYASTGDGILTSLKVLEVMLSEKSRLSALVCPMVRLPQLHVNVRVRDPAAAAAHPALAATVAEEERRLGGRGRLLVRASGTEPLVRVMCESESTEECRAVCDAVTRVIEANEEG